MRVDLLIVGGGPAGASLAYLASRAGFKVTVVERKHTPEQPTICGEYLPDWDVLRSSLSSYKDMLQFISDRFYSQELALNRTETLTLNFSGVKATFRFRGLVIDRAKAVSTLLEEAESHGANILLSTWYYGSKIHSDKVVSKIGSSSVESSYLIAADGYLSLAAKSAHLSSQLPPEDVALVTLQRTKCEHNEDDVYMEFSRIAPGGYAFIIPRGGLYNIGVGYPRSHRKKVTLAHREFLRKVKATPAGSKIHAKLLPVGGLVKKPTASRVLLIGDAVGAVMPTNGGGVPLAALTACLAAKALQSERPEEEYTCLLKPLSRLLQTGLVARRIGEKLVFNKILAKTMLKAIPKTVILAALSMDMRAKTLQLIKHWLVLSKPDSF